MSDGFTLEKFANHPFYQEVNKRLVALTRLHPGQKVVDVGAGTGAVTRLLVEEIASSPDSEVIAIDPSETAIEVARRNLENLSGADVETSASDVGTSEKTDPHATAQVDPLHPFSDS